MLCYCVLHVLRYFVHWDRCIKAMCSTVTVVCCNSNYCVPQFNLCRSQWHGCAKASRRVLVLQYCLAILIVLCKSLLVDGIGTATSWMRFECYMYETVCFFRVNGGSVGSCARRFRASSLCRRIRLDLRAQCNWGLQVTFSLFCFACVEILCALELVHQSDVIYSSVLQF